MPMMILLAPMLIVVRVVLFLSALFLFSLLAFVLDVGSNYPAALSPRRARVVNTFMRIYGFVCCVVLGQIVIRRNKPKYPKEPKVTVMNHVSLFDPVVCCTCFPGHPIMKHSTANNWAVRNMLKLIRVIFVKRDGEKVTKEV